MAESEPEGCSCGWEGGATSTETAVRGPDGTFPAPTYSNRANIIVQSSVVWMFAAVEQEYQRIYKIPRNQQSQISHLSFLEFHEVQMKFVDLDE